MRRLSDIDNQPASTLSCDHLICKHCGIVDRDHSRMMGGSCCSTCGAESEGGRLHFSINIHILVDLTQEAFLSSAPVGPISGEQASGIATILLFCALRETLLTKFLTDRLRAQNVPGKLIEKLLDDNKLANQKFGDLFSSVIGVAWNEAVAEASRHEGRSYEPVSLLMKQAATIRNEFLHEGAVWSASQEVAKSCLDGLPSLVSLFVSLHNLYVHPLVRDASAKP